MKILHLDVKGAKIPVVFESSKQLPVAAVKLVFKVAGACRDGKTAGLAAMAANILNEGTLSLGSAEFARLLEMRAINLGADAGFETLTISLNCLKEHLIYACEMLGALLREPNLTNEALERCKAVTLGEIAASEDDFDHVARCGLMEILYPKTPLAYANFGTAKSVENMKLEQVKDFIKTHLNLANLFISMGGDVSEKE
ncbi:insulinase family protein, partial [uncultured Campylobacter sp.]|uniref:M16 family metallopeptidase n=1 Tax=uncultured Campylobacter sp. TaxID=218934 RepID=UPI0025DE3D1B